MVIFAPISVGNSNFGRKAHFVLKIYYFVETRNFLGKLRFRPKLVILDTNFG